MIIPKWSSFPSEKYKYSQKIAAITKELIVSLSVGTNQRIVASKLKISMRTLGKLLDKFELPRKISVRNQLALIDLDKLKELIANNTSMIKCGDCFGVSVTTIRRFMIANHIPFRKRGNIPKIRTVNHEHIIYLYVNKNVPIAVIASLHNVEYRIIYYILVKSTVLRRRTPLYLIIKPEDILRMSEEGLTVKDMAIKLGVSAAGIQHFKTMYGIKYIPRGKKNAKK